MWITALTLENSRGTGPKAGTAVVPDSPVPTLPRVGWSSRQCTTLRCPHSNQEIL